MWDVAIIGAGLSGLTCARQLAAAGYSVCILDKSRGLGGRMATRRVDERIRVDHGLRYWQPQSAGLKALTEELLSAGVVKPWRVSAYEIRDRGVLVAVDSADSETKRYAAPAGMSAIAKFLAQPFTPEETLLMGHRATSVRRQAKGWQIECELAQPNERTTVQAKRCVVAIPAAQAAALLEQQRADDGAMSKAMAEPFRRKIAHLQKVTYFPCLTVLAGYQSRYHDEMGELDPTGWMVTDVAGTSTDWIALDSSKRSLNADTGPVIVIHSKAHFAEQYIDSPDLQPAGSVLLRANARKLASWLTQPEWFQIHRWRYAQINVSHPEAALMIEPTLVCGGDWCIPIQDGMADARADIEAGVVGHAMPKQPVYQSIDYAYQSGLAMAAALLP